MRRLCLPDARPRSIPCRRCERNSGPVRETVRSRASSGLQRSVDPPLPCRTPAGPNTMAFNCGSPPAKATLLVIAFFTHVAAGWRNEDPMNFRTHSRLNPSEEVRPPAERGAPLSRRSFVALVAAMGANATVSRPVNAAESGHDVYIVPNFHPASCGPATAVAPTVPTRVTNSSPPRKRDRS